MSDIDFLTIKQFLEDYEVPNHRNKPNFFQISRFPHYENVFSNVLAFFIEDNEIHKFGNIILRSILEYINVEFNKNEKIIDVIREETTEKHNRIDIVIITSSMVIGIENKINAFLYNDTNDYYNHLKELANSENKEIVPIILSKNKIEPPDHFYSMTHNELKEKIKKYYPDILKSADYRYFFLLNEFIENIEFLNGDYFMDNDFVKIAREKDNLNKINSIFSECLSTQKELRGKAQAILPKITVKNSFKNLWTYTEPAGIWGCAVLQDCIINGYNVTIDIYATINGFEIDLFERKGQSNEEFWNIIKTVIPDFSTNFQIGNPRASLIKKYELNELDDLINFIQEHIVNYFEEYMITNKK